LAANPSNDGIIIDFRYLPGGAAGQAHNSGKVLAAAVGNWLGECMVFAWALAFKLLFWCSADI
jgi:hypothetical protein